MELLKTRSARCWNDDGGRLRPTGEALARLCLELEGFRVIGTDETADEVEVAVALKIPGGVCPECSGVSTTVYQRTVVRVRRPVEGKADLPTVAQAPRRGRPGGPCRPTTGRPPCGG